MAARGRGRHVFSMRKMLAVLLALAIPAEAAELVMYETGTCAWCLRWHKDIGDRYAGTKAARLLPLRRVDMEKPTPADLAGIDRPHATPTFVIVACGREQGRIVGYSLQTRFWNQLADALNEVGPLDRCQ